MINQINSAPNGPQLSEMIQGYWRLLDWDMSNQQLLAFIKQHLELGITTVDHADIYGGGLCEQRFGDALALDPSLRDKLQVVTKCDIKRADTENNPRSVNHYNTSAEHIRYSVEKSLRHLQTDHLDVVLIHRPDHLMDADEVADIFSTLTKEGKVGHFGVSNFTPSQINVLQSRLQSPLATNQIEINPLNMAAMEDGTTDLLQQLRIRPMIWSCLAGGRLFADTSEQIERLRAELIAIGDELGGLSIDQVLFAWVMALPCKPLPVIGSGKIERIRTATEAAAVTLSREQWYRIWVAAKGHGVA